MASTALFRGVRPEGAPRTTRELLDQGKWWKNSGGDWVRVKEMTTPERVFAANVLIEGAPRFAQLMEEQGIAIFFSAPDDVFDSWLNECARRAADPQTWMHNTKLYRKLTKKIKPDMRVDDNR